VLLDDIIALATQSTFTKFPVYDDSLDQILGVVHVKDLLRAMRSPDCKDCTARSLVKEALFVPETISVRQLLQQFRQHRQHIAIVLDEFGGTAGLVTLEDLLEEIVGEVSDPFDTLTPKIEVLPDGTSLIDGLASIEDVNQDLGLNLVDPDYDTIAGFVLGKLGRIPRVNDTVEIDGLRLCVEEMDGLRIDRISLSRIET
jgi:putative hemolysin